MTPSYGVSLYDVPVERLLAVAVAAEQAGFSSIWLGEHLVLPVQYRSAHPSHRVATKPVPAVVAERTHLLDPLVALAAAAAVTSRIQLATGMYLLPLRHPLATARAAATLQEAAGGRFMLGVGTGWLEEEFDALGVPFAGRGDRQDEAVTVLRAAWRGGPFQHRGEAFRFGPVQVCTDPIEIPLVFGGNSAAGLRRAARYGDGWLTSGQPSLEEAVALRDRLARYCAEQDRPVPTCFVRLGRFDPPAVRRYHDAGLTDLVFWAHEIAPPGEDPGTAFARAAEALRL